VQLHECISSESDTHPVITDLEHFGKEEQQEVSPGLAVALRRQGQEVSHSITAHANKQKKSAF